MELLLGRVFGMSKIKMNLGARILMGGFFDMSTTDAAVGIQHGLLRFIRDKRFVQLFETAIVGWVSDHVAIAVRAYGRYLVLLHDLRFSHY